MENYKELPIMQIEMIMQETRDEIDSLEKKKTKLEGNIIETNDRLGILRSRKEELTEALEKNEAPSEGQTPESPDEVPKEDTDTQTGEGMMAEDDEESPR